MFFYMYMFFSSWIIFNPILTGLFESNIFNGGGGGGGGQFDPPFREYYYCYDFCFAENGLYITLLL